ncbi:histidine phosphatase family protein [Desulfocurvibacter africanus]|uniref:Phosphoglycerate mutase n=1 Tax=Desulfocurvibacter africanus subsp. africanus str. Walvis Bay TaxID=690850 RepID=F3YZX5_DESAF|nr:phosphoglycerate mutase family protein [Desulfocurvibacter africanus]EGJ50930.1 Phosphoglycerate mutase [Desulfocurvibacter africanus subsp. africanus str. Walvis Bay]
MHNIGHEIWLIRHGQSMANAGEMTTAPGTAGLTDLGRRQAAMIAKAIPRKPERIIVSPYDRTRQTAGPSMARFPDTAVEEWPLQEFTYLLPAKYNGTTLEQRRPMENEYWSRLDPAYVEGRGTESFLGMLDRVEAAWERLRQMQGFTLLFSHGQIMRAFFMLLFEGFLDYRQDTGRAMSMFLGLRTGLFIPNGSIMRIGLSEANADLLLGPLSMAHIPSELHSR